MKLMSLVMLILRWGSWSMSLCMLSWKSNFLKTWFMKASRNIVKQDIVSQFVACMFVRNSAYLLETFLWGSEEWIGRSTALWNWQILHSCNSWFLYKKQNKNIIGFMLEQQHVYKCLFVTALMDHNCHRTDV